MTIHCSLLIGTAVLFNQCFCDFVTMAKLLNVVILSAITFIVLLGMACYYLSYGGKAQDSEDKLQEDEEYNLEEYVDVN